MCLKGDFAHMEVLEEMYEKLQRRPRGDQSVEAPSQEVDDDDDDDGEEEKLEDGVEDGEAMEIDTRPTKLEPIVDEDGFQLVQGKGRRKGR
jgi:pre-rRNA-processing protein TSR2